MIVDHLSNHAAHHHLHPTFKSAFEFLQQTDLTNLQEGTQILIENQLSAIVAHASGRKQEEGKLEAHHRFIDIQYLISGNESIGWAPTSSCTPNAPYNAERDLIFFNDTPTGSVTLSSGMFAIFYPEDAHMPLIGEGAIHKVILKVAIES